MLNFVTSFLFDLTRVVIFDLASALTLRDYDLDYFTPYDYFSFF
jgi:hypothetical protein